MQKFRFLWLAGAPLLFLVLVIWARQQPPALSVALCTAAVAIWMAIWWLTEAIPLGITSLLPVVLFPSLGIMDGQRVSGLYFNEVIFLFMGGFLVALAMQRWQLHRRLALLILAFFGVRPRGILTGFMLATAFLSMWISNTATAMMMLPIALAILDKFETELGREQVKPYAIGLCLAIAYSASVGGIATLVGTPPNLAFVKIYALSFPEAPMINFAQWMLFALPICLLLLAFLWGFLVLFYTRGMQELKLGRDMLQREKESLGPMILEERLVLYHFVMLAVLWMTRTDLQLGAWVWSGWADFFFSQPELGIQGSVWLNDGTVSVALGISLFLYPSQRSESKRLMDVDVLQKMPWPIILLFGGGFALAQGFKDSGLSTLLGQQLEGLANLPTFWLVLTITCAMTFLTELTSNTATAQTILPILAALAVQLQLHPLLLMIPATLAASFAFMLPVATPPNAIVFSSQRLSIMDMAKAGLILNLLGVLLSALMVFVWGSQVFGNLLSLPDWLN